MFLSSEGRITMGIGNSGNQIRRDFFCSSQMYFAKKNTFLEVKAPEKPVENRCNLI